MAPLRGRLARLALPVLISVGVVALLAAVLTWRLLADLPSPYMLIHRIAPDSTKLYDRHGEVIFEILDPRAGRRTRIPLADLPQHFREAVIAIEDAGFYRNPGVAPVGVARAVRDWVASGRPVTGGSTITQQLAREVLLPAEERAQRSLTRKLREMWLAVGITARYPKDTILEMYVNEVYFGQLAYGVEAASQTFFGKPARQLDLAESALLAGLIQSPSVTNPLVEPAAAFRRQQIVLGRMVAEGYITVEESKLAGAEPLHFAGGGVPLAAPHYVAWVQSQLESRLGREALHAGGLHIITSLDLTFQRTAEAIVANRVAELQVRGKSGIDHNVSSAALVALDPATGHVLALVGSADYYDAEIQGAVNVARSPRQPGSAFKPVTYAAAFDPDRTGPARRPQYPDLPFTAATVLSDVPTSFVTAELEPYRPLNYDRRWHGPISLRRALATSSNLVAVKVLDAVGIDPVLDLAADLGITTFQPRERFGLALTLGGGEVTLLELTAAYAALANGGRRVSPVTILAVSETDPWAAGAAPGLIAAADGLSPEPVVDPRVAYLITDILADDHARMPAFGEGGVLALARPAAAKTGTTTDFRDNWTIGYTPDLATGVWLGNPDNRPMQYISGITGAAPIWKSFMERAHAGRPVREFPRPEGLVTLEVCESSGLLPSPDCQRRRRESFVAGTQPTQVDDTHVALLVDPATQRVWDAACGGRPARRVYRLLPPEAVNWGRARGHPMPPEVDCLGRSLAATAASAGAAPRPAGLEVVLPAQFATFAVDTSVPAAIQRIELLAIATGREPVSGVRFVLNGSEVAAATAAPFRVHWPLTPGRHSLQAVATLGTGQAVTSPVTYFTVLPGEPSANP